MTRLDLPRGYSIGTQGKRFVFTWVETAEVQVGDASDPYRGGVTITQRSGRISETYATPATAAEAAREHASRRGA